MFDKSLFHDLLQLASLGSSSMSLKKRRYIHIYIYCSSVSLKNKKQDIYIYIYLERSMDGILHGTDGARFEKKQ